MLVNISLNLQYKAPYERLQSFASMDQPHHIRTYLGHSPELSQQGSPAKWSQNMPSQENRESHPYYQRTLPLIQTFTSQLAFVSISKTALQFLFIVSRNHARQKALAVQRRSGPVRESSRARHSLLSPPSPPLVPSWCVQA